MFPEGEAADRAALAKAALITLAASPTAPAPEVRAAVDGIERKRGRSLSPGRSGRCPIDMAAALAEAAADAAARAGSGLAFWKRAWFGTTVHSAAAVAAAAVAGAAGMPLQTNPWARVHQPGHFTGCDAAGEASARTHAAAATDHSQSQLCPFGPSPGPRKAVHMCCGAGSPDAVHPQR